MEIWNVSGDHLEPIRTMALDADAALETAKGVARLALIPVRLEAWLASATVEKVEEAADAGRAPLVDHLIDP